MAAITSVGGLLSLLEEDEVALQHYGLQKLNSLVNQFWSEIAESVTQIEILYEETAFPYRKLAALLLSKIYYNLGEYQDALSFALCAEDLFDSTDEGFYTKTIVNTAIEKYITLREQAWDQGDDQAKGIDARLQSVVEGMFQRCFEAKNYGLVIGIALESRRLDVLRKALEQGNTAQLIQYVQHDCFPLLQSIRFRQKVLRVLLEIQLDQEVPEYEAICQCLMHLNEPVTCAELLLDLITQGHDEALLKAYQVAFDLVENATQGFLAKVIQHLTSDDTTLPADNSALVNLKSIFSGKQSIRLHLEFLFGNNHTDLAVLKATKDSLDSRNSVYHSGVTFANAFMYAGTTVDDFLRSNMEWLQRATNWTKFSAAAGLGVIHMGQVDRALSLMSRYLPQDGVSNSPYSEGGAFFALGLINANRGGKVLEYLTNALTGYQSRDVEILQHGACLGLGAAGMATADANVFDSLKDVLYTDSAVAGEAAGLAMGLVMLGTAAAEPLEEMLQYAHETQHEKIIRGLAVGMSFVMYERQDEADPLISQLCEDKDPILRYGGMYTIAMAYCGTGNNKAIERLLHFAVSDVSDDVRRAAVTALGFILFRTPEQVPRMVQLLAESYNPHVRYGATLALGISCAGTGSKDAIALLEPMTRDSNDHVRQGALVALGMILIQQSEAANSSVPTVRKLYDTTISDQHSDVMTKFGATLGQGIIDAGGRNVTISLQTRSGYTNMPAVVGMALFTQFWFWYPLTHFLSLAFTPTAFIGLDKNLQIPKMQFISRAKPALFAYPEPLQAPTADVAVKVATAVLSTTARAKARAKKAEREKEKEQGDKAMDVDTATKPPAVDTAATMDMDEPESSATKAAAKPEKAMETLDNMSRVVPAQWRYVSFPTDSRYKPVKGGALGGILLLRDLRPDQAQELMPSALRGKSSESSSSHSSELRLPSPFEYPFGNDN